MDDHTLDVDDIPFAADFDVHSAPAHPLWTCCPSPAPDPSQRTFYKFESVSEKKKSRCGDREYCRGWRNQTKEETMRNRVEEMRYVPTKCPSTACISGKLTHPSTMSHPNTKSSSQEKTNAAHRPWKKNGLQRSNFEVLIEAGIFSEIRQNKHKKGQ